MSSLSSSACCKLLCWIVAGVLLSQPAQASCAALPVLSDIVQEVEVMEGLTDAGAVARSGRRIDALRRNLTKASTYERLRPLGYERMLGDVMKFKVKLGALGQMAISQGPEKVKPYLTGSGFQRSYQRVKELTQNLCGSKSLGAPSNGFWGWTGLSNSNYGRVKSPFLSVGLLLLSIGLLAALFFAYQLRDKLARREARLKKRVSCKIPVTFEVLGVTSSQMMVDLSVSGARIQTKRPLPSNASMTINFGSLARLITVTWSNDHYAGIEFDEPLTQEQLAETLEL